MSPENALLLLSRLSQNFENLFQNSNNNYDMIINIGDENDSNYKTFYAHSLILTTQSTYFKTALSEDWIKKDGDKIIFEKPNISPKIFEVILKHLYCGIVSLDDFTPLELLDLLSAINEFMLPELMRYIESHLLSLAYSWVNTDIDKFFFHAQKFTECENLREYCTRIICVNPELLFNSDDFVNLDKEILIDLLKRDDLGMKEIEIWRYVIKWGIHKCFNNLSEKNLSEWNNENFNELWEILKDHIKLIRFNDISKEDFSEIKPYSLMFPRDIYENLLWNYTQQNEVIEVFSNKKPARGKRLAGFFPLPFGLVSQPASSELFGAFKPTGSGFGQTTTSSTPFGFGTTQPAGFGFGTTQPTGSGFGRTTQPTGFGFGIAQPTGSGFGQTTTSTPFGFGTTQPTGSGFSQVTTSSTPFGFGQTTQSTGFGFRTTQTTQSTGFGFRTTQTTQSTGFGFGTTQPTGSGFGQTTQSTGFGFGIAQPTGSGFGQTTQSTGFGFGTTQPTGSGFGQTTQSTGFGFGIAQPTGSGFGQTTQPTGFGIAQPTSSGFGQTTQPTGFGIAQPTSSGFGQTTTSSTPFGFGTTQPTGFGFSQATTSTPFGLGSFGQTTQPAGFGQATTSSTPFGFSQTTQPTGSSFGQTTTTSAPFGFGQT